MVRVVRTDATGDQDMDRSSPRRYAPMYHVSVLQYRSVYTDQANL